MALNRRQLAIGVLYGVLGTLVVMAASVLLIASSGLYSVAASSGHLSLIKMFLEFGMQRSVSTWSVAVEPPPADIESPDRIAVGAAHFLGGCANCHGAPGIQVNALPDHMLPPPPGLSGHVYGWTSKQLFWIVQNGIKYTGMPHWSGAGRSDEVWSVVAFLLALPKLDSKSYATLARGNSSPNPNDRSPIESVARGNPSSQLTVCDRCHDTAHAGTSNSLVPRLGGQAYAYIVQSLRDYRSDHRQSGFMEPVATALDDDDIRLAAEHYSALSSSRQSGEPTADEQSVSRGRVLAEQGDTALGIPPCNACHGVNKLPEYPSLAAQRAPYTAGQLVLWQQGGRTQTPRGSLMATIAGRLAPQQILDVAAYYQDQPAPVPANVRAPASIDPQ